MEPNLLFLRRVTQLAMLVESRDEFDLIDIAARLRQLLFDKHSLVDSVTEKVPLSFDVGVFPAFMEPANDPHWDKVVFAGLIDGIDPHIRAGASSVTLNRDELGRHVVAYSNGEKFTIKDIVKFNANRRGGQHYDPRPHPEFRKFQVIQNVHAGNARAGTAEMRAIGKVVLRGLEPLVKRLQSLEA